MDTIFALASGRGRAGVAVIRVSGPASFKIVEAICGDVPKARVASLRKLRWQDEVIDQALVVIFAAGASFTGEESAEFHVHGGLAVIEAIFRMLRSFGNVRIAEPGEFTRRALENGRLQLFEVEGLIDLIDAETEAQRKQAQRMLQGGLTQKVDSWRGDLLHIAALVEASIDFADEDLPVDVWPEVLGGTQRLIAGLEQELGGFQSAARIRSGFEVAVFGPPNVGKSSLINALVQRDVAIVSERAGTTRDIIETRFDIGGLPIVLLDTAGLRETDDPIESEGIRRARQRVMDADVKILVLDSTTRNWDSELVADLTLTAKADLGIVHPNGMAVSSVTGEGLDLLRGAIGDLVAAKASLAGVVVNERHHAGVTFARLALEEARAMIGRKEDEAVIAMKLREARSALESLVGRIEVEEVLGAIFGRFCIGK